jgi:lipopolysaccharide/colanic/teichoic acid biosynthesis glycosyltransferase
VPDGARVLLTVGRFVRDKGYLELATAARKLLADYRDLVLVWIAPVLGGEDGTIDESVLRDPALAGRVIRLERQSAMASAYAAADLLVHPTHREGVPRVLMEAAAAGLPIVATDIPGNREVVSEPETALLFRAGDPVSLEAAVRRALDDPAGSAARAERAGQRIRERFDQNALSGRVAAVYRELVGSTPRRSWWWKRPLDLLLLALVAAPALAVGALVAVLVRWRLGGPVLFVQERPGRDGRPFRLVKFRSMREGLGPDGRPLPDEARLTDFGRWLRATSLDELPELWNVLRGEMSFVGPRPLLLEYLPLYDSSQARRMEAPPGITGWAQIRGRNASTWSDRFRDDVWYVDHASPALDLRILAATIVAVLRRDGIAQPGHATMERFRGNA